MHWDIKIKVDKRRTVDELLQAIQRIESMSSRDVRIERWDRNQLREAEILRRGAGRAGSWTRWILEGKNWFLDSGQPDVSPRPQTEAKGRGLAWVPPRRGGRRLDPIKASMRQRAARARST
jgi:hypothetical protein